MGLFLNDNIIFTLARISKKKNWIEMTELFQRNTNTLNSHIIFIPFLLLQM